MILCKIDDIAVNGSKQFALPDGDIFAVRTNTGVFLYRNRCPHLGLPLNWQPDVFLDQNAELIVCSSHGARFDIVDGYCVAGPCVGKALEAVGYEICDNEIILTDS